MRLLVAEDNAMLGEGLVTALTREGYTVDWVQNGPEALHAARHTDYALIILDLGLPGQDGMSILRTLRQQKRRMPILILTARDTLDDKIQGLDTGADDFLTKPFELNELLARLRALQRRASQLDSAQIIHGELALDTRDHSVTWRGESVPLSRREYAILYALLEKPGKILSREKLEESLYGWHDDVSSNTIEVHIHNLRKKLHPELIRTIRGVGYMVDAIRT